MSEYYKILGKQKPSFWTGFRNFYAFSLSLIDRLDGIEKIESGNWHHLNEMIVWPEKYDFVKPGSILVGAHVGDWLLSGYCFAMALDVPLALVVETGKTPAFFEKIAKYFNGKITFIDPVKESSGYILSIKKVVESGGIVCMLADRFLDNTQTDPIPFANGQLNVFRYPFKIAQSLNCPINHFTCVKPGLWPKAKYYVLVEQIWHPDQGKIDTQIVMQRFASNLAKITRRWPHQWFNFNVHNLLQF